MDLVQAMRVFRRVVELRSFSAAARDQKMSNAAVSKQLAALEDRLRTRLLHRTTRRLSPTSAGASYYQRCVRILEDIEDTEQSLSGTSAAPTGSLRVNAPLSFGVMHMTPLLPELLQRWPDLDIDLSLSDRFVDVIEEGVDVVVRITAELADSANLVGQRLAKVRQLLCAAPAYLRKHGVPTSLEDLKKHQCLVYSGSLTPGEWGLMTPDGPARVQVKGRLAVNSSLVLRDALVRGLGLCLMPEFYVGEALRTGKLRLIMPGYSGRSIYVHAVYPRTRHLLPRVRLFIDFLRERFSKAEWAEPP